MNIVVCAKQVPNTQNVQINSETKNIVREGIPSILNPYDANAIEESLKIRDLTGGHVTAISMGPLQAADVLQEALDMGADRAILLCDRLFAGADTLATGYTLSVIIKRLNADLVLCGSEAIDGSTGQVGPIIAENLGWPQMTCVRKIKIGRNTIAGIREQKDGMEQLEGKLPMVICVQKGINQPRAGMPSGKRPEIFSADDVGFDKSLLGVVGSPTRVVQISMSGKGVSGFVFIDGSMPVEKRVRTMMRGGITPRKINFVRGDTEKLTSVILKDEEVKKYID